VNDAYGHGEGNRVLCVAARTLSESLRETDKIARLGGDEFALLLPDTDAAGAGAAIAHAHERLGQVLSAGARSVTCSVGAVTFHERQLGAEQAMNAADALMYAVKGRGKNAVAVGVYDATLGVAVTRSHEPEAVLLERSG
jgi:diguanylate cyclase (GGDEF)-like protein